MDVVIRHALERLAGQARGKEVVDVAVLRVQQVEDIDRQLQPR